jgi:nucleotide-binding universal stress UspA family protein
MTTTERSHEESPVAKRIVVGVDGSPASIRALQWAGRVGGALQVPILAITAWEYPAMYGASAIGMSGWRPDEDAGHSLNDAIDEAFGDHKPTDLQTEVVQGYPSKVMLDAGDRAEMLVLGSRGHGGFVGLLLGSVSAHCAELATCPVVVVHDKSDEQR